jgi:ABC-type amino acid transport substrate-binding protein
MMDDVPLAGVRQLAAKPADRAIVGTQQSAQAYGFMLRKDDPPFNALVDGVLVQLMKRGEIVGRTTSGSRSRCRRTGSRATSR